MDDKEAKWDDWLCFIKMLEAISIRAHQYNQAIESNPSLPQHYKYFYGTLYLFIAMMKELDKLILYPLSKSLYF